MSILDVVGVVIKPIADAWKARQDRKTVEHTNNMELLKAQGERAAQLVREGLSADANWEMEFARQAATSWKDEYTLIVVSLPAILCFCGPRGAQIVSDGFAALDKTPLWYQLIFGSMFLATVGIRYWRRTQSDT